jgi:hypothetical protein
MLILTQLSSEESQEIFHIGSRDRQAAQFTGTVSQDFKQFYSLKERRDEVKIKSN